MSARYAQILEDLRSPFCGPWHGRDIIFHFYTHRKTARHSPKTIGILAMKLDYLTLTSLRVTK